MTERWRAVDGTVVEAAILSIPQTPHCAGSPGVSPRQKWKVVYPGQRCQEPVCACSAVYRLLPQCPPFYALFWPGTFISSCVDSHARV